MMNELERAVFAAVYASRTVIEGTDFDDDVKFAARAVRALRRVDVEALIDPPPHPCLGLLRHLNDTVVSPSAMAQSMRENKTILSLWQLAESKGLVEMGPFEVVITDKGRRLLSGRKTSVEELAEAVEEGK